MFLLDPLRGRSRADIRRVIEQTSTKTAAFLRALGRTDSSLIASVRHLHDDLVLLNTLTADLFESRMDVRAQARQTHPPVYQPKSLPAGPASADFKASATRFGVNGLIR
jgi:hypothetical protein